MNKSLIKDLLIFVISFVLYYVFGTGLIYLILKAIYNANNSLFPLYISDAQYTERGLSNIAQLISSIIIALVIVIVYFKDLKGHFSFLKGYKLFFKTIGYALFVYFVTICYNLFLPLAGGTGEDGSNVALIKASMKNQFFLMLVLVVIIGPIIEELLFRFIPFKALKDKIPGWCLILVSTILFTIPHMLSLFKSSDLLGDILALPKYLIIGCMIGSYYYKNNEIGRSILIHMVYNIISFVLMSFSLSLI